MLTDVYPAQPRNAAILAIALQSSYLLLTPSAKTKTIRRWRPTKLITACTTPRAPLPNMDSLFQPRKSHRQNIARSMFHTCNLSNPFRLVRVEPKSLPARVDRIGRYPVARHSTRRTSKRSHHRPRQTHEALSWRSQHLITSPPGHPREERTWVDGVKGGAPPGLAALSENASPAQRGPRREKTTKMRRSDLL